MGQTMFNICSFEAKNRVYQKMNTLQSIEFSKNDGRVCSMSNLIALLGLMFGVGLFKAENRV